MMVLMNPLINSSNVQAPMKSHVEKVINNKEHGELHTEPRYLKNGLGGYGPVYTVHKLSMLKNFRWSLRVNLETVGEKVTVEEINKRWDLQLVERYKKHVLDAIVEWKHFSQLVHSFVACQPPHTTHSATQLEQSLTQTFTHLKKSKCFPRTGILFDSYQ